MFTKLEVSDLFSKIKKQLILCIVAITFFLGLVSAEAIASNPKDLVSNQLKTQFSVAEKFQDNLAITYELGKSAQKFTLNSSLAPKIIQSNENPAQFKLFDSTYIALDAQTSLSTLVFTNDKYHSALTQGSILVSNATDLKTTTIQVGNIVVEPYLNGKFTLSNIDNQIEVQVLEGNAEVGVYSSEGKLQRKFLLAKYNMVSAFDGFAEEGEINIQKLVKNSPVSDSLSSLIPTFGTLINTDSIFTLKYKGSEVKPTESSRLANTFSQASFNPKRKNYHYLAPFYSELNKVILKSQERPITDSDISKLRSIYGENIAGNVQALELFRNTLVEKYPYILAIRADDNLYKLKLFLDQYLTFVSPAAKTLSSLEDLYLLYPEGKIVQITEITDNIQNIIPELGKQDTLNIIAIIDNIVETTIQANSKDLYDLRTLASKNLTTTIEKTQFRTVSQQHMLRMQTAFNSNQLPTVQIKGAVTALLENLDSLGQARYQDFLLSLD
jgi:hypothetical protein